MSTRTRTATVKPGVVRKTAAPQTDAATAAPDTKPKAKPKAKAAKPTAKKDGKAKKGGPRGSAASRAARMERQVAKAKRATGVIARAEERWVKVRARMEPGEWEAYCTARELTPTHTFRSRFA